MSPATADTGLRTRARDLAAAATTALVDEATLTPKPGLVDRASGGAHQDMDVALLLRSARVLDPWFADMATLAAGHDAPSVRLRGELAALGRAAEHDMLLATGGVNTHRGAIWALGLLLAAAAMRPQASAPMLAALAGEIARLPDPHRSPPAQLSHGMVAWIGYGAAGARGQAEAGFPHVVRIALPMLRTGGSNTADTTARLDALLALMAGLDDTCVLHRGGASGLRVVQRGAAAVLAAGGAAGATGRARVAALDRRLTHRGLSPGGSADLLAAALFLDAVAEPDPLPARPREDSLCRH